VEEPQPDAEGRPSLPPGQLVALALRFYGVLLAAAFLWRVAWAGEPILYASSEAAARGVQPVRDVVTGLLAAGIVIGLSWQLTSHTAAGRALARALAAMVGPLGPRHIVALALLSGVAEEAFFRGALQPRVGYAAASVLFGLAHFVPRPEFRLWTLFSIAAGFLLGGLFEATGNLIAPVVAHAGINAVNLTLLVRGGPWSGSEEGTDGAGPPGEG
jgi:membrane protease YdiL (CAAX protease family)